MNLLNRYLQAVGQYLPSARRADIVAELRANILSQMEDAEEGLNRPLTEDEQADLLRRVGNPSIIAGRYNEHNFGLSFGRQLIGPVLFPIYKTVLKVNLAITAIVVASLFPILKLVGVAEITLVRVLIPLLAQFVAVTAIFIGIDKYKGSLLDNWDPRRLPALKTNPDDPPRGQEVFGFVALAVGTMWLALTPQWPYLMLGPGALYLPALRITPMPHWTSFYWAILVLLCAQLTVHAFGVFRLRPRRQVRVMSLILKGVGLGINVLLLLEAPNYVTSPHVEVANWANQIFLVAVLVSLGINLWEAAKLWMKLRRERDQLLPAGQH
jgi:hypothetical protein